MSQSPNNLRRGDSVPRRVVLGLLAALVCVVGLAVTPPAARADNYPPIVLDSSNTQFIFVKSGESVTFSPLGGAIDPDGDDMSVVVVTGPSKGSVNCSADGDCVYTPNVDLPGSGPQIIQDDPFTYQVKDTSGMTSNDAQVVMKIIGRDETDGAHYHPGLAGCYYSGQYYGPRPPYEIRGEVTFLRKNADDGQTGQYLIQPFWSYMHDIYGWRSLSFSNRIVGVSDDGRLYDSFTFGYSGDGGASENSRIYTSWASSDPSGQGATGIKDAKIFTCPPRADRSRFAMIGHITVKDQSGGEFDLQVVELNEVVAPGRILHELQVTNQSLAQNVTDFTFYAIMDAYKDSYGDAPRSFPIKSLGRPDAVYTDMPGYRLYLIMHEGDVMGVGSGDYPEPIAGIEEGATLGITGDEHSTLAVGYGSLSHNLTPGESVKLAYEERMYGTGDVDWLEQKAKLVYSDDASGQTVPPRPGAKVEFTGDSYAPIGLTQATVEAGLPEG
ncbi:MAG: cadherin-like domain-containing protein, partial [Propionibacteriaceae bacterium]|nr:cadherin-like domain-containing protein [Propionibacteriaceae bacterium]